MKGRGGGAVDYTENAIWLRNAEGLIWQHVAFIIQALVDQCLKRIFLNQR